MVLENTTWSIPDFMTSSTNSDDYPGPKDRILCYINYLNNFDVMNFRMAIASIKNSVSEHKRHDF